MIRDVDDDATESTRERVDEMVYGEMCGPHGLGARRAPFLVEPEPGPAQAERGSAHGVYVPRS